MATRPLDSARLREIAQDVEKILSNYDRIKDEADYRKFFSGIVAWRKANLDKGGSRDLMKYLYDRIQYISNDPDRQMDVFRKKAQPLSDLAHTITPNFEYDVWLRIRRRWKEDVEKALAGLPAVGAWLDKLRQDKKRDLKPEFAQASEQNVSIDGFHMIFHEYDEDNPKHREFLDMVTDALKTYQQKAKRYLPEMLRHKLPMDIMFGEAYSSGNYGNGKVTIHQKSMKDRAKIVYTIAHETGHYFGLDWMSQSARAFWIAAIKQDMKPIKLSELLAKWPLSAPDFLAWVRDARDHDPVLAMQLEAIWYGFVNMPKGFVDADKWTREGLEEYLQTHEDSELRIMQTPITPYANQNPDEAFAEAVALLVAYGPQAVHSQVREWLKIVLPGEIKLAQAESGDCLLAVKALARFAVSIDKVTIERWKKDLKSMTKIYRDLEIPSSMDFNADRSSWDEARLLFRKFRENLEEWTYKVLLPRPNSDRPESPLEKSIRKLVWDLRFNLDEHTLFPSLRNTPGNTPDWSVLRNSRDKNIKRYQASATKAFKEIEIYLGSKPEEKVERRDAVDHFLVSGIQVVVKNFGREGLEREEDLDGFLRGLKHAADRIARVGFGRAVKGLTVTVDFDPRHDEGLVAGTYQPEPDMLRMLPLGIVGDDKGHGTFTHECGHRFYYRALPGPSRAHWEEVMESRGVKITPADVERFADLIVSKADQLNSRMYEKAERLKATVPHAKDEAESAKFTELATLPPKSLLEEGFDAQLYRDRLKEFYEGTVVQLEEITEYANTNASEAFAECFREWVMKGPRALGPWTRQFFAETCRAGGARLASVRLADNVLRRFFGSEGEVVRPDGWNASNDTPRKWDRGGHLYRGMTEQEWRAHHHAGYIKSTGAYSHPSEGTNFADNAAEAESYVNFGRDDPRKTGRPTYLIEVKLDEDLFDRWPDGYYKAKDALPLGIMTRAWKMVGEDGQVVAYKVK
jgi:hypothetical protein